MRVQRVERLAGRRKKDGRRRKWKFVGKSEGKVSSSSISAFASAFLRLLFFLQHFRRDHESCRELLGRFSRVRTRPKKHHSV